jgi:hypothetical protein
MPHKFLVVLAIALGLTSAHGQSLGDIARANRDKQNSATPAASQPAVITSDDLEAGTGGNGRDGQDPAAKVSKVAAHGRAEQDAIDPRVAAQWKKQIVAQQDKIATLQGKIDVLNAAIHPAGSAQFNGPYNKYQTTQMQRLADVQLQMDEQKKKLVEMQEEARKAGMHTTVYDP